MIKTKKISTYRTKLSYEHVKLIDNFEDTKFQNSNRMNNCSLSYTVLLAIEYTSIRVRNNNQLSTFVKPMGLLMTSLV